ncbi:MAG TPA: nuclear transport factor 2 family protein [Luteimonas sp.]|nr:nuclear transport factor 2 family protein [Luteimonas sp.]
MHCTAFADGRNGPRSLTYAWSAALACLLGAGLSALPGCSTPAPEQQLRETIAALQASIEAGDAAALEDVLADDFVGPDGLDRRGARRLATLYFLRETRIGVTAGPLEIRMQPDHATVRTTAALTGRAGGLLPDSASLRAFESGWRREGDDWKMTSARWDDTR